MYPFSKILHNSAAYCNLHYSLLKFQSTYILDPLADDTVRSCQMPLPVIISRCTMNRINATLVKYQNKLFHYLNKDFYRSYRLPFPVGLLPNPINTPFKPVVLNQIEIEKVVGRICVGGRYVLIGSVKIISGSCITISIIYKSRIILKRAIMIACRVHRIS